MRRSRIIVGLSTTAATLAAVTACGTESVGDPGAQPSPSAPSISASPATPSTSATPHGTPGTDCPQPIKAVQQDVEKATWGKGMAKARFDPVTVTICRYDAGAAGNAYATGQTKRTQTASVQLFTLVNAADPAEAKPEICTKELGPTYVLRFTDIERGVLTYVAEAFGCRRLVATSFEGDGKPLGLAAPRQVTPQLLKSLGMR